MNILVTGIAGFIGYHLALRLAIRGDIVTGIDNLNQYYDVNLKLARLNELEKNHFPNLSFVKMDLNDAPELENLFKENHFDIVIHLAAQAGVRYSLENPDIYISSNIQGFLTLLETIRKYPVRHFLYASSSSVYGLNTQQPFSEKSAVDNPASLYAVTKRSNELMAFTYSHLYGIPATGMRFFTVYGPWGRPDMALFLFTKAILENRPIEVFNNGNMKRDFTYIDDIVDGIMLLINHIPAGYAVFNIGHGSPVSLFDFINALAAALNTTVQMNMMPLQPGDIPATWADCSALEKAVGYHSKTNIHEGIKNFTEWYVSYYKQEAKN
jgi:UDP-glucuronate 4-epimerase